MPRILAADIGGTNSRFALFEADAHGQLSMARRAWLPTRRADSFAHLVRQLREDDSGIDPATADATVVAFAGPVEGGVRSRPPNIAWSVDVSTAEADFGLRRARLVNDFTAQAFACLSPAVDQALDVLPGTPDPDAPLAVIGAGTGLGMCALVPDGRGGRAPLPSEGGHVHFPFAGDREFDYHRFLARETGRPIIIHDLVVSGPGLALLHRFLTGRDLAPEQAAAECGPDAETTAWFARFYGRACRNWALATMSLGGVFVSGGVAARNPGLVRHPAFEAEFRASETHAAILARIPVRLNTNEDSGLWGAAAYGLQLVR